MTMFLDCKSPFQMRGLEASDCLFNELNNWVNEDMDEGVTMVLEFSVWWTWKVLAKPAQ